MAPSDEITELNEDWTLTGWTAHWGLPLVADGVGLLAVVSQVLLCGWPAAPGLKCSPLAVCCKGNKKALPTLLWPVWHQWGWHPTHRLYLCSGRTNEPHVCMWSRRCLCCRCSTHSGFTSSSSSLRFHFNVPPEFKRPDCHSCKLTTSLGVCSSNLLFLTSVTSYCPGSFAIFIFFLNVFF